MLKGVITSRDGHGREHRLRRPGGQDGHHRRLHGRLVRRLHAALLDRGLGRLPGRAGRRWARGAFGGTYAAPIWHDYMLAAQGADCPDFPAPENPVEFSPGAARTPSASRAPTPPTARQGARPADTNGDQRSGGNGQYPSDLYAPGAGTGPAPSPGGGGGSPAAPGGGRGPGARARPETVGGPDSAKGGGRRSRSARSRPPRSRSRLRGPSSSPGTNAGSRSAGCSAPTATVSGSGATPTSTALWSRSSPTSAWSSARAARVAASWAGRSSPRRGVRVAPPLLSLDVFSYISYARLGAFTG